MCNLMRTSLIIAFILKLGFVLGQPAILFETPLLREEGLTMTSFVRDGWTIVDSTKGDLNGDNEKDIAFVIESKDSLTTYSFIEQEGEQLVHKMLTEKYQRRILIIAFKDPKKDFFNLIEQSNSIIIGINTKIEIKNSHLEIEYNSYDEGQNFRGYHKYYFSHQNKELLLTSVDGFTTDWLWNTHFVIDFISMKLELTNGKVNVGKPNIVLKNIDNIQPKTMKEFKEPGSWYIAEGIMI